MNKINIKNIIPGYFSFREQFESGEVSMHTVRT